MNFVFKNLFIPIFTFFIGRQLGVHLFRLNTYAFFTVLILCFGSSGQPKDVFVRESGAFIYTDVEMPEFVYLWRNFSSLTNFSKDMNSDGTIRRFRKNYQIPNILLNWPSMNLGSQGLLFTWIHPVTGFKGGLNESYGDTLIKIQLNKTKGRALLIDEPFSSFSNPKSDIFDFSGFDVIMRRGPISEIIILNPEVILRATADPLILSSELKSHLKSMSDPMFTYPEEDQHISRSIRLGPFETNEAMRTIQDYLSKDRAEIPPSLLNPIASDSEKWTWPRPAIPSDFFVSWFLNRIRQLLYEIDSGKWAGMAKDFESIFLNLDDPGLREIYSRIKPEDVELLRYTLTNVRKIKHHDVGSALAKFLRVVIPYSRSPEEKKSIQRIITMIAENEPVLNWIESNNKNIDLFSIIWEKRGDYLKVRLGEFKHRNLNTCRTFYQF